MAYEQESRYNTLTGHFIKGSYLVDHFSGVHFETVV